MASERFSLFLDAKATGKTDVEGLSAAINKLVGSFERQQSFDKAAKSAKAASDEARKAANEATRAVEANAAKIVALTGAVAGYGAVIKSAVIDSATYAARTQTLTVVTDQLAKVNRMNEAAVRAQVDAVKAQGITSQQAYQTVNKMIFAQLDLRRATDLARLSQDAAVIAGMNSSQALEGIIHGIVTRQPEVLRTYGIAITFEEEFAKAASKLGRELTATEKTQVALSRVLAEGSKITGSYEAAMGTAGKQMGSLQRYVEEARNELGKQFLPTLSTVVQMAAGAAKNVQDNAEAYANLAKFVGGATAALATYKAVAGTVSMIEGGGLIRAASSVVGGSTAGAVAGLGAVTLGTGAFLAYQQQQETLERLEAQFKGSANGAEQFRQKIGPLIAGLKDGTNSAKDLDAAIRESFEGGSQRKTLVDLVAGDFGRASFKNQQFTDYLKNVLRLDPKVVQAAVDSGSEIGKALWGALVAQFSKDVPVDPTAGLGLKFVNPQAEEFKRRFLASPEGRDARLKQVNSDIEAARLKLSDDSIYGQARTEAQAAFDAGIREKRQLEAANKAFQDAKTLAERMKRLTEESSKLIREAMQDAFLQEAGIDVSKLTESQKKLRELNADSSITGTARAAQRGALSAKIAIELAARREKEARDIREAMQEANYALVTHPVTDNSPLDGVLGRNRLPVLASYDDLIANARATAQQNIERVAFGASPDDQFRVLNTQIAMRLDLRKQEYDLQLKAADLITDETERERQRVALGQQYNRDVLDIRFEKERAIARFREQQRQEGRNTFTSLFDAGVAGGQGLRSFLTSTTMSIPRTMAGNLGEMFGGLTGRFTLPGVTSTNMLGKLLAGTPFGVDPMKAAGDVQMTAAKIQLEAATINAGRGASGGTIGSVINGASGLLSFGKGSSAPGVVVTDALGLTMPTLNANGTVSSPFRYAGLTKGLGAGAALAAGAFGAYSGFSAGGAQGALTGMASIAGSVGTVLPMISKSLAMAGPIGAVSGIALGLGAMLLGDPKAKRRSELESEASSRRFTEPTGADYVQDIYGRGVGYDYRGDLRPVVVNNYNETNINAMDAGSFTDYLKQNPAALATGMSSAIMSGNADDVVGSLRVAMAS